MTSPILRGALRRALLLSLSVPAFVACGGNVVVDGNGTGTGGGTSGDACVLFSSTPISVTNGGCQESFAFAGTPADCMAGTGGELTPAQCQALCPVNPQMKTALSCSVTANTGAPGGSTLACIYAICGTGRRPPGFAPPREAGPADPVARFLGQVAHLEAASVLAFDRLAAELEAHGAPEALVRGARRSAREEVRHACVTWRFAERAGARPEPVSIVAEGAPPRSLEAIAADNATEGCVRETFGAVLAMRQAGRARRPGLRRAMESIARDETRHAELSWEIARWVDGRLDDAARRRVREERDRAVASLRREIEAEPRPSLAGELGLPTSAQARAAFAELHASLWS